MFPCHSLLRAGLRVYRNGWEPRVSQNPALPTVASCPWDLHDMFAICFYFWTHLHTLFEKYQSSQNQGNFVPSCSKAVIVNAFLIQSEHKLISQHAAKYTHTTLLACDSQPLALATLSFLNVTKRDVFLSKRKGNCFRCQWWEA